MRIRVTLLVVTALALIVFGYRLLRRDYVVTADNDGSAVARVVAATIYARSDLRVSEITGTVQGTGQASRLWGWLPSSQVVKAPFSVDYLIPLRRLDSGAYRYDASRRVLFIEIPDVEPQRPNIDLANTTLSETSGLFVTRGAMAELGKKVAGSAQTAASAFARRAENLDRARRAGRRDVERLFSGVLRAARSDVRVEVRYAFEPQPIDGERWDLTRSLQEVLGGAR